MTESSNKGSAYDRMAEAFGGAKVGHRTAGALLQADITSMDQLNDLLDELGEQALELLLCDLPDIGAGSLKRIWKGLAAHRGETLGAVRSIGSDAERYEEMVDAFGGPGTGNRIANSMLRIDIKSLAELDEASRQLGDDGLMRRLDAIQNIGPTSLERVKVALEQFRKARNDQPSPNGKEG